MSLDQPRLPPSGPDDWDAEVQAILERVARHSGGQVLNVMSTVARHPDLLKRWMPFGNHIMGSNTLPKPARELVVLRTSLHAHCAYEWVQHVSIARAVGVSDEEIERVIDGPDAPGWSDAERALLRATDELLADDFVTDPTWSALCEHWSEHQRIDLVFTLGQYRMVAMALNTFGVQIEDGVDRFPESLFRNGHFAARPK